jgi:EAL domain-containing protein (putative c-di-GMP-specific phosphodiesterase class I)/CheY-like chemotaxis protein
VLVVDDDPDARRLLSSVLRRAGVATVEAGGGALALDIVRTEPVDLVLLDGRMPEMSGLEVVAELRARRESAMLPVIMVTAASDVEARVAGLEAGADDYLTKPADLDELVARVRSQLRRHGAWQRTARAVEHRAAIIEALARLPRGLSAEETAQSACELLSEELEGVAIVAFADNTATVLAARGLLRWPLLPGAQVPERRGALLRALARRGPWHTLIDAAQLDEDLQPSCGVPLVVDGRILAALLVSAPTGQTHGEASEQLSAMTGYGAVVAALLAHGLEQRVSDSRRRAALARVVEANALSTHFQPIVALRTRRVVGYEALTRWADGTPPDTRLDMARELGYTYELERTMLDRALIQAHSLPPGRWLSVNLSAAFVVQETTLHRLLSQADRPIVIEITEQEPVHDYAALRHACGTLGGGVRIAVDDAGAGYASLRHILALEPSIVKLDLGWIRGIDRDRARQALVAGLQHFASETGRSLVAEGIENADEFRTLRRLGITFGQGFFLGRPASAATLAEASPE